MKDRYEFDATVEPVEGKGGAFVRVPIDILTEFGKGRFDSRHAFPGPVELKIS